MLWASSGSERLCGHPVGRWCRFDRQHYGGSELARISRDPDEHPCVGRILVIKHDQGSTGVPHLRDRGHPKNTDAFDILSACNFSEKWHYRPCNSEKT